VNALIERHGGEIVRQRGSHRLYRVEGNGETAQTVVPQHSRELPQGTARAIERDLEPVLGKGWLRRWKR
jgi:predicted RNA binding protein YcfA (HicA-like mRNA interferase family)